MENGIHTLITAVSHISRWPLNFKSTGFFTSLVDGLHIKLNGQTVKKIACFVFTYLYGWYEEKKFFWLRILSNLLNELRIND